MRRTEDRPNALRSATAPGVLEMLQSANIGKEEYLSLSFSARFCFADGFAFSTVLMHQ